VNLIWDFRKDRFRFAGIVVQEYDHKQRKLVGPMSKILEKNGVIIEGPNLYKHNDWYYLMLAEGGTGWMHGISMARAKNLSGPYEFDPQPSVLTSREDASLAIQKAGHGELVQTQSGEWYLAHLASRPLVAGDQRRCVLGRETYLQKVDWRDGWLRLASGGTKPWSEVSGPANLPFHPWPAPSERDHFDSVTLDECWSSLRVPVDESWLSLDARPGWLRLFGRDSQHSLFEQSLVARRVQHFRFTAETCLDFSPDNFMQSAGLICYYDTRMHYYLRVTFHPTRGKILCITLTDDGSYDELSDGEIIVDDWKLFFLRAEVDFQKLHFSASPDGKNWRNIGPVLDASKLSDDYGSGLHFTGAMVGLCAQDLSGAKWCADFDYFDYRPANP
jgi:xylan 1,4-beta-xylosidase